MEEDPLLQRRQRIDIGDVARPAIDQVFTLGDIVEAHRHFEKGIHAGKIVVTV